MFLIIFNMFDIKKIHFSILALLFLLCGCTKTFNVKAKQSNYKIVKASLGNVKCEMSKITFKEQEDGVFISNDDLTLLANNINNFKICYFNLLETNKANLSYYENIITALGGEFVSDI